ncbi:MAG TPA: YraN family protein [Candidatus Paceibacterota bacterium]
MTTKEIGNLGEGIACRHLEGKGFTVIARNYLKKWGEIDIVAHETNRKLHFIEVKTVTRETGDFPRAISSLHRPEDNVHPQKLKRMRRVIQSYLLEKRSELCDWQFDVVTVVIHIKDKTATCRTILNVVL